MTEVILFHHAQGRTDGVLEFAGQLKAAGHRVTVPDLYDGTTFDDLAEGVAYAGKAGFDTIIERGSLAAGTLPQDVVYAGFSLGVLPAQMLAQTRPGAKGALLFHACVPPSEFGPWPPGVPVQVHAMDADQFFAAEGDLDAARDLAATVEGPSCSSTPANSTCSRTAACPATTRARPRCSCSVCSASWANIR